MEQLIQKVRGKMGAPHVSVKLCEKWPMPTSWAEAASMSRAVLLQGEKCPFLSCFCSELAGSGKQTSTFGGSSITSSLRLSPHLDKTLDAVPAVSGGISSAELV